MVTKHKRQRSQGSLNGSISSLFQKTLNPAHHMRGRIVRKAAGVVDTYVNDLTSKAPYLLTCDNSEAQDCPNDISSCMSTIPLLDRQELLLGKLLGEGGFCQVWDVTGIVLDNITASSNNSEQDKARKELARTTPPLAVKQLRKRLTKDPPRFTLAAADLVVEAQYLSRLCHPHICPVRAMTRGHLTAMANDGRYDAYFLVLDKLETTLDQRISHWQRGLEIMPEYGRKLEYALQIASALQYLHQRRIIFRDVKPHNIGFRADNQQLQLFDFGLCRELPAPRPKPQVVEDDDVVEDDSEFDGDASAEEYNRSMEEEEEQDDDEEDDDEEDDVDLDDYYLMTKVGTRRYAAVEMFISGRYNEKVDCYSWAMTVYEMISLCKPFASLTDGDHQEYVCAQGRRPNCKAFLQQCEQPPRGQPQPLLTLVREAWEQYVRNRIDMDTIVERLEEIIDERQEQGQHYVVTPINATTASPDKEVVSVVSATTATATESDQEELLLASSSGEGSPLAASAHVAEVTLDEDDDDDEETVEEDIGSVHSLLFVGGTNTSIAESRGSILSTTSCESHRQSNGDSDDNIVRWDDSINTLEGAGLMVETSLNHIVFDELLQHRQRTADMGITPVSPLGSPLTDNAKNSQRGGGTPSSSKGRDLSPAVTAALAPPTLIPAGSRSSFSGIAQPTLTRIVSGGAKEDEGYDNEEEELEEPQPQD